MDARNSPENNLQLQAGVSRWTIFGCVGGLLTEDRRCALSACAADPAGAEHFPVIGEIFPGGAPEIP